VEHQLKKECVTGYYDETSPISCPYGEVRRIITGGKGGIANVHVVSVTAGSPHYHRGCDEVYYLLSGTGTITLDNVYYPLRPGAAVVIPANTVHSLQADPGNKLEFVIFTTPPVNVDDERFKPISHENSNP